jgi:uncharacterized protein
MTAAAPAPTRHPIPRAALDDRLAFVGTTGSGKTYNAGTAVERLIKSGARVVIPDPLGVWYGLRLQADGRTPAYPVVIFGGEHADLPLTEHAGAIIGEAVATTTESCIVDLSDIGTKAAERRFMLAFLTALYRKTPGDRLHVIFDEADMWAPQQLTDKEGDAAKLLGMMETIVRRGRIKGFVPWLITQRPAVLNKNVLSQVDGLVAMKLTSSQDRAALGDWIEGQADRAEGKRILAEMPALQRGQGVVWIPGRGILSTSDFPRKATFDSSRAPERGEPKRTLQLKPLDLQALSRKLEKVDAEIKANDPRALRLQVAELQRQLRTAEARKPEAPAIAAEAIRAEAYEAGRAAEHASAFRTGFLSCWEQVSAALQAIEAKAPKLPALQRAAASVAPVRQPPLAPPPRQTAPVIDGLTAPMLSVLEALAFWRSLGFDHPTRAQVGAASGRSPSSGGFNNLLGALRSGGLIDYQTAGTVTLTPAGCAAAPPVDRLSTTRERLSKILTAPQARLLDALPRDGSSMTRDELGAATDYSATSGGFNNLLGSLRSLGLVDYPNKGLVAVKEWVWG